MTTNSRGAAAIRPFRIDIPEADLADLRARIANTRLPQPAPEDDARYGVTAAWLTAALARWAELDWRAVEARLNEFAQYVTEIDGQPVHFVHVPSAEPGATPLLLAHSYPGSFVDFLDLIGPLTDPVAHGGRAEDAFSVVIPSAPGVGFSSPVVGGGWTTARVAGLFDTLMRRLGYSTYGVHGSDFGANVARELGLLQPEGLVGLHVLQAFSFPSGAEGEFDTLGPKDYAALEFMQWFQSVGGYNTMNASRPQTVAVGLADSPAGQLAYSELFMGFDRPSSVPLDAILTEVSVAWFANSAAGQVRYYFEDARAAAEPSVNHAPMGVALFPDDFQSIRAFADRDNDNIVHWTEHERGGHYAALEVPDLLVGDIRAFFGGLRS